MEWHPGPRVYAVNDVQVGDLLLHDSFTLAGQPNLTRVTRLGEDGRGFYGLFVDLTDPAQKRLASDGEFFTWDFMLQSQPWRRAQNAPYRDEPQPRSRLSLLADPS